MGLGVVVPKHPHLWRTPCSKGEHDLSNPLHFGLTKEGAVYCRTCKVEYKRQWNWGAALARYWTCRGGYWDTQAGRTWLQKSSSIQSL